MVCRAEKRGAFPAIDQHSEATGMAALLVRCPIFGREFSVGVETDEASLALIPEARAQALCPYCGIEHQWSTRDARLSEIGVPAERATAKVD